MLADEQAHLAARVEPPVRAERQAAEAVAPLGRETESVLLADEEPVPVVQVHVGDAVVERADPEAVGVVFQQGEDVVAVGSVEEVVLAVARHVVAQELVGLHAEFQQARAARADPDVAVVRVCHREARPVEDPGIALREGFVKHVEAAVPRGGENPADAILEQGADAVLRRHLPGGVHRQEFEIFPVEDDALQAAPAGADPQVALEIGQHRGHARLGIPALLEILAEERDQAMRVGVVPVETALRGIDPEVVPRVRQAAERPFAGIPPFQRDMPPGAVVEVVQLESVAVRPDQQLRPSGDLADAGDVCGQLRRQGSELKVLVAEDLANGTDIQAAVRGRGAEGGNVV